ncbi:MAG: hypothetical protein OQK04_17190, partial [Kangiellaceae bacterium]|nr:hypothetical protein [Kangiellaceae bacterium]
VDFKGVLSKPLQIELCGILCFTVNWDERVNIGAFLLYYQEGLRLTPNADDESVVYIPRELDAWGKASIQIGEGDEWSQYDTPERWKKIGGSTS